MKYEMLDRLLEEKRAVFENVSDRIWEFAETRFQEKQSAALQKETLRAEGFEIEENLGGIETAFSAKFGAGHPVIGILGEYDALPGMSQKADLTKKSRKQRAHRDTAAATIFWAPDVWKRLWR
ncbi:MAG: hypothetical protein ACLRMZ_18990 [Blautia marasmi]